MIDNILANSHNPSFENSFSAWVVTSWGSPTTIVTSPVYSGLQAVRFQNSGNTIYGSYFPVYPGLTYTAKAKFFSNSGNSARINLYDQTSNTSQYVEMAGNGDWQEISVTRTFSLGTDLAKVFLYGSLADDIVYDDVEVTRWIDGQFDQPISSPVRAFYIGGSDYSSRVVKWPKVKQEASQGQVIGNLRSQTVTIQLANNDGGLNDFYKVSYSVQNTCSLKVGFVNSEGANELLTIFSGKINSVRYPSDGVCEVKIRDRIYDFTQFEVGAQDSAQVFSGTPSVIAWNICTSFGGLSAITSISNPDINYQKFREWAYQCSNDNLFMSVRLEGKKGFEGIQSLLQMADSALYVDGDGKLCFYRFSESGSLGTVFDRTKLKSMQIDVEANALINQQFVNFNYDVTSDSFANRIVSQDSTSVNTYGLRADTIEDEIAWFNDSGSALNLADRRIRRYANPPIMFKNVGGLYGIYREIGQTAFLVNSFYDIGSNSGWRVVSKEIDLQDGAITWGIDEALLRNAFYLDITSLDGNELLL